MDTSQITEYFKNNLGDVIFNFILAATFFSLPWIWTRISGIFSVTTEDNPLKELRRILLTLLFQVGCLSIYLGILLLTSLIAPDNSWGSPASIKGAGIGLSFGLAWCTYRSAWKIAKIDFSKS